MRTMVGYQQFVSIVFDVARSRGRDVSSLEASQKVLSTAAAMWSDNKSTLKNASEAEARSWVQNNS